MFKPKAIFKIILLTAVVFFLVQWKELWRSSEHNGLLAILGHEKTQRAHLWTSSEDSLVVSKRANDNSTPISGHTERSACKIPEIDPFDKSVLAFVKKLPPLNCGHQPPLTQLVNGNLIIDPVLRKTFYKDFVDSCEYRTFDHTLGDDNQVNMSRFIAFTHSVNVDCCDFIEVKCYSGEVMTYSNVHAHASRYGHQGADWKSKRFTRSNRDGRNLSVLLLFNDGLSRLNAIRQLPKTYKFLTETLSAITMKGYHSIGVNTFYNVVPLLTGKYYTSVRNTTFDDFPFVWKNFSRSGYVTYYLEDKMYSTFNFGKKGFYSKPTDYYARPLFVHTETNMKDFIMNSEKYCFRDKPIHAVVGDYLKGFLIKHHDTPYFALHFFNELSHDLINPIQYVDGYYSLLLGHLHENGYLNNTALFFLSDHGNRFDSIRLTSVGRYEERLPLLTVSLPPWFQTKHPHIISALHKNTERPTSPYDVYATLLDILGSSRQSLKRPRNIQGLSLFKEIPKSRTCSNAGIPSSLCVCNKETQTNVSSPTVLQAAALSVKHINKKIANDKGCYQLSLSRVLAAFKIGDPVEDIIGTGKKSTGRLRQDYLVMFVTSPGGAVFEQMVQMYLKEPRFNRPSGPVSRLNKYGSTSWCIKNFALKTFCYCKSPPPNY